MRFASPRGAAVTLLAAAVLAHYAMAAGPNDAAVAAATRQADQWLKAMDEHRYSEAWRRQSSPAKEGRSEQEWAREISGPREALGRPVMRQYKTAEFSTRVQGAPEGQYVTVVYLTKFSNIPLASEIVLLSLENEEWLVDGYSVAEADNAPRAPDARAPAAPPKSKD